MWVRLEAVKQIDVLGKPRTFHRGDWVEVGKMDALQWLADGSATIPSTQWGPLLAGCGVVLGQGPIPQSLKDMGMEVVVGPRRLRWEKTLLLRDARSIAGSLAPVGFELLERWDVAMPLYSYDTLAANIGSDEDRERTREVIHDLRVPVYDTRALFMRDCDDARDLLQWWNEGHGDEMLSFLRALYLVKPLICALPVQWTRA